MKTKKMLTTAATFLVLGGEKYYGGYISPLGEVAGVMVSTLVHKTKMQEVDGDKDQDAAKNKEKLKPITPEDEPIDPRGSTHISQPDLPASPVEPIPGPLASSVPESVKVENCGDLDETLSLFRAQLATMSGKVLSSYREIGKKAHDCERAVDNQGKQCDVWTYKMFPPGRILRCRKAGDHTGMEPGAIKVPASCWDVHFFWGKSNWFLHSTCRSGIP
ncbi:unnamed protein product [Amoebophrya sp. A120]|nr:unnamed protein product [Amoebophrya sp. A120]|eukprot:GSA120T00004500001.1